MKISYLPLAWNEYHQTAQKLAATILSHGKTYDEIVAISRGGLTLGHLLSDFMLLPVATFTIQSYQNIQAHGKPEITETLGTSIILKNILLVDDVSDSGKTFIRGIEYLKDLRPASITTVSMFYKPHSSFLPDFYAKQTKKWILFPYEPTEMISLISANLTKEKKTKPEIQDFLLSLGYTPSQIAFVRKYHLAQTIQ